MSQNHLLRYNLRILFFLFFTSLIIPRLSSINPLKTPNYFTSSSLRSSGSSFLRPRNVSVIFSNTPASLASKRYATRRLITKGRHTYVFCSQMLSHTYSRMELQKQLSQDGRSIHMSVSPFVKATWSKFFELSQN